MDLDADSSMPCFWPRMLSKLRNLRHLAVHSYENLMSTPHDWLSSITSLPPTLEFLCLSSADCESAFINRDPDPESDVIHSSNYALGVSNWIDLASLFPRLTSLDVNCEVFQNVAALPPTLTSLGTSYSYIKLEHLSFLSRLPRSLKRLDSRFPVQKLSAADLLDAWSQAPPELEFITHVSWNQNIKDMSWLPRTLVDGEIAHSALAPDCWTFERCASFPPLFRSLTLLRVDVASFLGRNWVLELPRSLTSLEYTVHAGSPSLGTYIVHLPPRLQKLVLSTHGSYPVDWKLLSSFVKMENGKNSSFSMWPSSLTDMAIEDPTFLPESFELLPTTLISLKLVINYSPFLTSPSIPLHLYTPQLKTLIFDGHTKPSKIPREMPFTLPPSITHLETLWWPFASFHLLPRSITSFESSVLLDTPIIDALDKDLFTELPTGLKSLQLFVRCAPSPISIVLSPSSFASLKLLRSLTIHGDVHFPSTMLRCLPKSLLRLSIKFDSLEVEDLPFISQELVHFSLRGVSLPSIDMLARHWPLRATRPRLSSQEREIWQAIITARWTEKKQHY